MKKYVRFLFLCLLCAGGLNAPLHAQVLSEDFESGDFPEDWVWINADGLTPALPEDVGWADTAWIVGTSTTFEGFAVLSISWYEDANGTEVGPADDWLITPKITIPEGAALTFDAKSATSSGDFPDDYWVLINTGDPTKESFEDSGEILLQVSEEESVEFRNVEVDLANFVGQDVHLAFRNVTNTNGYGLWLDNIEVAAIGVATQEVDAAYFNMKVGPNPATDFTNLQYQLSERAAVTIVIQDAQGRIVFQEKAGPQLEGTYNFELPVQQYANGTYLVSVRTPNKIGTTQLLIAR